MDETDEEMMEVVDFDVTSEPSTDKNTGTSVPNEFSLNIVSDKQTRDMRNMIQPTSEVLMDSNKFPKKAKKKHWKTDKRHFKSYGKSKNRKIEREEEEEAKLTEHEYMKSEEKITAP